MGSALSTGGPTHGGHGWAYYADGTRISQVTAQNISATTRTQILNDATGRVVETQLRSMPAPWASNKLVAQLDCFYIVRLTFKGQIAAGGAGHYLTIELDINGAVGVLWSGIDLFAKGADVEHAFQYSLPLFAGADFVEYGGTFYITTDVAADIWDVDVLVNRTYIPN